MVYKTAIGELFAKLFDTQRGERYSSILRYFIPEFVTALILSSVLNIIDAYFISFLHSTSKLATVTVTSMLIQFVMKVAEGLSTGTVVLGGAHNGRKDYVQTGQVFATALWTTVIIGGAISGALILGAYYICSFFNIPDDMIEITVSFLRLRAIGIFLLFIFFAVVGFLRAIKNARAPMYFFVIGSCVFILADYACIFGEFGVPAYGFYGSAIAFILQYAVMLIAALGYIFLHPRMRSYAVTLIPDHPFVQAREIIQLSWPVMLDKATLAGAKMWLIRLIGPLGTVPLASFGMIKDIEQLAFVPAIAFAQVITFLSSNDYGLGQWSSIIANIKKIITLASIMVFTALVVLAMYPQAVMSVFDSTKTFGTFAASAFVYISALVFFDIVQLILAGAMRGASQVQLVMKTRAVVGTCVFVPLSLACAWAPIANTLTKFILVYGSFYLANGVMSLVYIWRLRKYRNQPQYVQPAAQAKEQNGTHYRPRGSKTRRDFPHLRR